MAAPSPAGGGSWVAGGGRPAPAAARSSGVTVGSVGVNSGSIPAPRETAAAAPARAESFTAAAPGTDTAARPGLSPDDAAREVAKLARQATVFVLKCAAATVRFLFEDCVQSFCQVVFLIKRWHDPSVSNSSRIFTMCSIAAGLFTSFAGPVKELIAYRAIQAQRNKLMPEENEAAAALIKNAESKLAEYEQNTGIKPSLQMKGALLVPDVTVEDFLLNKEGKHRHATMAYVLLMTTNIIFWGTMVALPIFLDEKLHCGGDLPATGHLIFFGVSILAVLVEVWVIIHSKRGYLLFRDHLAKFFLAVGFSFLGRFDTYSDITFYKILSDCEPITWFSIHKHVVNLPFRLASLSYWCLIIGVGLLQAVPGILLLMCKIQLPMGLKFSEFNLILEVVQDDAAQKEEEEDLALE